MTSWTKEDAEAFMADCERQVKQYENYTPNQFINEMKSSAVKQELLSNFLDNFPNEAKEYIYNQLVNEENETELTCLLVNYTFEVSFQAETQREKLCESLLNLTRKYRSSKETQAEDICRAAIQRTASIINENKIPELFKFLETKEEWIDTRFSTLLGIAKLRTDELKRYSKEIQDNLERLLFKTLEEPESSEKNSILNECFFILVLVDYPEITNIAQTLIDKNYTFIVKFCGGWEEKDNPIFKRINSLAKETK